MTIVLVWKREGQSPTPSEFKSGNETLFATMEELIDHLRDTPWPEGFKPWADVGTGIMQPHTLEGFLGRNRNPIRSWS